MKTIKCNLELQIQPHVETTKKCFQNYPSYLHSIFVPPSTVPTILSINVDNFQ